jgi:signal transduction histidine kinase
VAELPDGAIATRPPGTSPYPLDVAARDRRILRRLGDARVSTTAAQALIAAAVVPMVLVTAWLAVGSEHLARPVAAAIYWSYLVFATMAIGLYWWVRRPASRFGPLLVVLGVLIWVGSWQGASSPLAFDVGVLAEAPMFLLTFYLFLAFPMGRLEPPAALWLMVALGVGVVAFFLPWALFSPVIAGGGPLTRCALACPPNILQIDSAPGLVEVAGKAETYTALTVTAVAMIVYLVRLRTASRPQRRALVAVAVTSLLFLPAYFVFNFAAWILMLDPATLDTLAWGIVVTRILMPLGFLLALLRAERFAFIVQRKLLEQLAARPTPEQWRDTVATALDDGPLRLGFHDPATGRFSEPDGQELTPPPDESQRAWVPVERDGRPVAAMILDETLTEDPELVRVAASATLLAVEHGALEGKLRASRARILEAGHAERRRIERNLHDSTQQRLVALRIQLALAGEQLESSPQRALFEHLGVEVDEAIDELREVSRGVYPPVLAQEGLDAAIKAVARRSSIPVRVLSENLGRHAEPLETTVYFCCLECLQNAAKHAGPRASVVIRLGHDGGSVRFSVEDDGTGFDPAAVERGAGLTNLEDPVVAVGGRLSIESEPGRGTRITGDLPA